MAITVKELTEQLSKYRPEAEVGMHSSLEGVVRVGQAESMVVLYVESDFDNEDDDEDDDDDDREEDEDVLEDDICPRCEEEEADCIC